MFDVERCFEGFIIKTVQFPVKPGSELGLRVADFKGYVVVEAFPDRDLLCPPQVPVGAFLLGIGNEKVKSSKHAQILVNRFTELQPNGQVLFTFAWTADQEAKAAEEHREQRALRQQQARAQQARQQAARQQAEHARQQAEAEQARQQTEQAEHARQQAEQARQQAEQARHQAAWARHQKARAQAARAQAARAQAARAQAARQQAAEAAEAEQADARLLTLYSTGGFLPNTEGSQGKKRSHGDDREIPRRKQRTEQRTQQHEHHLQQQVQQLQQQVQQLQQQVQQVQQQVQHQQQLQDAAATLLGVRGSHAARGY